MIIVSKELPIIPIARGIIAMPGDFWVEWSVEKLSAFVVPLLFSGASFLFFSAVSFFEAELVFGALPEDFMPGEGADFFLVDLAGLRSSIGGLTGPPFGSTIILFPLILCQHKHFVRQLNRQAWVQSSKFVLSNMAVPTVG